MYNLNTLEIYFDTLRKQYNAGTAAVSLPNLEFKAHSVYGTRV
jgi:hypothetical protein